MDTDLVLTVIGDDRPGLVEKLAAAISAHNGNWLESSLSQLAGKFAGIVRVQCDAAALPDLRAALNALDGLRITAEIAGSRDAGPRRSLQLSLVGHDRVGIVREVSQVLARHTVNVESLDTWTSSAPMSGDTLFHADATLTATPALDARQLKGDLEAISAELVVDITLDEILSV